MNDTSDRADSSPRLKAGASSAILVIFDLKVNINQRKIIVRRNISSLTQPNNIGSLGWFIRSSMRRSQYISARHHPPVAPPSTPSKRRSLNSHTCKTI